jgi:hypothetical protein
VIEPVWRSWARPMRCTGLESRRGWRACWPPRIAHDVANHPCAAVGFAGLIGQDVSSCLSHVSSWAHARSSHDRKPLMVGKLETRELPPSHVAQQTRGPL